MLVMIVATATTWRARATDLAALRMAGLPGRSLRRMELLGQLPVVLVGALAGAGCGIVAAVLALPGVRQFTDPPAVDTTDFSTPWARRAGRRRGRRVLLTALAVAAVAVDRAPRAAEPDPRRWSDGPPKLSTGPGREARRRADCRCAPAGSCTSTAARAATWRRCPAST